MARVGGGRGTARVGGDRGAARVGGDRGAARVGGGSGRYMQNCKEKNSSGSVLFITTHMHFKPRVDNNSYLIQDS